MSVTLPLQPTSHFDARGHQNKGSLTLILNNHGYVKFIILYNIPNHRIISTCVSHTYFQ